MIKRASKVLAFIITSGLILAQAQTPSEYQLKAAFIDHSLANLSLLSQRVFKGIDISVGVYNLFNTSYADPGREEHRQLSIQQDGRTWRFKLTYGFGGDR